jgi:signal transduction histidine kinase
MEAAVEITGSEAASILLMDNNTRELRFAATTSQNSQKLMGITVPLEGSIAGTIIQGNSALIIDDASTDPRIYRQVDESINFVTRSLMGVPMRIKDKLIGVLEVLNKIDDRYSEEDVRHITILASQAAVAIENAQLIREIRQAYTDLEKVNKLKNDFIAIASHELRTPLGVILGYASFLREDAQGEAGEHAERVMNSAMHLRNLIEDMTNLRYVQLDESELDIKDVPLIDVLMDAYNDTLKLAEAKEQGLLFEPPRQSFIIQVDHNLIAMALTNLLNNAVKFTDRRGIIILSAEPRHGEVWIKVKDNGVGLEEAQLERVFDQFYQVEDHMTRRHNGLGLGLTIARAVAERHKGRTWCESQGLGQGATFFMALPIVNP